MKILISPEGAHHSRCSHTSVLVSTVPRVGEFIHVGFDLEPLVVTNVAHYADTDRYERESGFPVAFVEVRLPEGSTESADAFADKWRRMRDRDYERQHNE